MSAAKDFLIYNQVSRPLNTFVPVRIFDYTPVITNDAVTTGEILRYFTRPVHQLSTSDIQEIDETTFTNLINHNFYTTVSLRWQIAGPLDDTYGLTDDQSIVRLRTGVITANTLNVELANEKLPGLSSIITDYSRFYQGV